jgi:hypothetical protein
LWEPSCCDILEVKGTCIALRDIHKIVADANEPLVLWESSYPAIGQGLHTVMAIQ